MTPRFAKRCWRRPVETFGASVALRISCVCSWPPSVLSYKPGMGWENISQAIAFNLYTSPANKSPHALNACYISLVLKQTFVIALFPPTLAPQFSVEFICRSRAHLASHADHQTNERPCFECDCIDVFFCFVPVCVGIGSVSKALLYRCLIAAPISRLRRAHLTQGSFIFEAFACKCRIVYL